MSTVYQIATDKIVAMLEAGTVPWRQPWASRRPDGTLTVPTNLVSKRPYRGLNVPLLALLGYQSPYWVSFKQAQQLGGHVRKGERSSIAIFWKTDTAWVEDEDGKTTERPTFILRYYSVFNVEQCEGLDDHIPVFPGDGASFEPITEAQRIIDAMPNRPAIRHAEQSAYYHPLAEYVNMPAPETFGQREEYYSTLFHELTHSTGHKSRVGRKLGERLAPFGSPDYSREELVAEMGAAFLCATSGIENVTLSNSASYLHYWTRALRGDSKLIIHAAAAAQKAADYILGKVSTT